MGHDDIRQANVLPPRDPRDSVHGQVLLQGHPHDQPAAAVGGQGELAVFAGDCCPPLTVSDHLDGHARERFSPGVQDSAAQDGQSIRVEVLVFQEERRGELLDGRGDGLVDADSLRRDDHRAARPAHPTAVHTRFVLVLLAIRAGRRAVLFHTDLAHAVRILQATSASTATWTAPAAIDSRLVPVLDIVAAGTAAFIDSFLLSTKTKEAVRVLQALEAVGAPGVAFPPAVNACL